jgi:hypothetical protein
MPLTCTLGESLCIALSLVFNSPTPIQHHHKQIIVHFFHAASYSLVVDWWDTTNFLHTCASKVRDANCPNGCLSLLSSWLSSLFLHSFMLGLKRPTIANFPILAQQQLHSCKWNNHLGYKVCNHGVNGKWWTQMIHWDIWTTHIYIHTCLSLSLYIYIYGHIFSHRYQICTFWKLGFVINIT